MINLRRNSYFTDPIHGSERKERDKARNRARETARHFDDALDHFLAGKVNKGELVKLRSNDLFDLYEIPKDQLRGQTIRRTMEPTASDWKGSGPTSPVASNCGKSEQVDTETSEQVDTEASAKDEIEDPLEDMLVRNHTNRRKGLGVHLQKGMQTTFSRQATIDSAPSSPPEMKTDLKDEVTPGRANSAQDNTSSTLHSVDNGLAKDLACSENVSGEAINAAKRSMYRRHAASWCPSSTPSNDREKQEIRNLSFCASTKNRTPIPHISAWWNNMLMHKSQSLSH
jgi:hypothetical protein